MYLYDDLLAKNNLYKKLWDAQVGSFLDDEIKANLNKES